MALRWMTVLLCLAFATACAVGSAWAQCCSHGKHKDADPPGRPGHEHQGQPGDESGDDGGGDEAQGPREGHIILEDDQDESQDEEAAVRVKGVVRRVRKTEDGDLVSFVLASKTDDGEPQQLAIRVTKATRYREGGEKADSAIIREELALEVVLRAEPRGGRGTAVLVIARADRSEWHENDAPPEEHTKP